MNQYEEAKIIEAHMKDAYDALNQYIEAPTGESIAESVEKTLSNMGHDVKVRYDEQGQALYITYHQPVWELDVTINVT